MSSNNDNNKNIDIIPLSLVYPINSGVYKNVLLIDTEVKDAQLFASSANEDTFPITYSRASTKTELSALLKTKFPNSIIERIGLVFTSDGVIVKKRASLFLKSSFVEIYCCDSSTVIRFNDNI